MNSKQFTFLLPVFLLLLATSHAQTALICNDFITVSLGSNCTRAIAPGEILEGTYQIPIDDFIVELDKTAPFGNGPWVPADIDINDVGKTYTIRVKDPVFGNICWGNVSIEEPLACTGFTLVQLPAGQPAVLQSQDLQIALGNNCLPVNGATTTMGNGQSLLTYDCSDLGVHLLPVQMVTPGNVTLSCTTTLVVDDPFSECDTCVSCPAAASVNIFQGGDTLVAAWQAGDWSAFDQFGDPAYNTACGILDSSYTVEYVPSAFGQSWFVRRWEGQDASGQPAGACEQIITFPSSRTFTINGRVFIDSIPDCSWSAGEAPYRFFNIRVTKLPSNETVVKLPAFDGTYSFEVEMNGLDTAVQVQLQLPQGFNSSCPTTLLIPAADTAAQYTFDMGLRIEQECPALFVDISTPFHRRCVLNHFYVRYCNFSIIPATNVWAVIEFDSMFEVQSASIPWSDVVGNTYTFPLGTVPALSCTTFYVSALLSCEAELGQTFCTEISLLPPDPCGGVSWNGPVIETDAFCDGDSVRLIVKNTGAGNMTDPGVYFVIEDVIMYRSGNFLLNAGDSIGFAMLANGATWRIEAEQVEGFPELSLPASAVEGCNDLINTPGLINAFPPNENGSQHDVVCEEVRGSFDPNDKAAIPAGYGDDHIIRANTDLEYRIRFQNTGTDTAFRVVIIDTLSKWLDPASLQAGASSHPYRLDVYGDGILHFVFDPIALPDSNVNEPASHGFVNFRIAQKPDMPNGTVIENTAAIYFDFNEPVITNTVWHTIGAPFVTVEVDQPYAERIAVEVSPNPFRERTLIRISGMEFLDGALQLFDLNGRVLHTQQFLGNQCTLEYPNLAPGMYFFRITEKGRQVAGGKMVVRG